MRRRALAMWAAPLASALLALNVICTPVLADEWAGYDDSYAYEETAADAGTAADDSAGVSGSSAADDSADSAASTSETNDATTTPTQTSAAAETTGVAEVVETSLVCSGGQDTSALLDGTYDSYVAFDAGESLEVSSWDGSAIGGLYVRWYALPGVWTLRYTDAAGTAHEQPCGQNGFLHEYVALERGGATSCELVFQGDAIACTVDAYGTGGLPADVQTWDVPCEAADFMVCSTHADDEILWLGGVLATYAGGQGLATQVVYMTNYWDGDVRREHEKLDGLWSIGVRNYPVNAPFSDIYAEDLPTAQAIYDEDEVAEFFVEQVRRFKPLVVVCQDFGGEYGHGAHQVLARAVQVAVDRSADASVYGDSAQEFGTWDVPKAYFHLYDQNRITLNLREPIEALGGLTAIEAMERAYALHETQQWTWFYISDDPNDELADQVNCSEFGLYRSLVGADTGSDMLEHVTTYEEQAAQAEQARLEEARAREEAAKAEREAAAAQSEADAKVAAIPVVRVPLPFVALCIAAVIIVVMVIAFLLGR